MSGMAPDEALLTGYKPLAAPGTPKRHGAGRFSELHSPQEEEEEATTFLARLHQALDRTFSITQRGSTVSTELRAGTTAFLATANNFIVNAHVMSHAGLDIQTSVVSGAFASALGCILSGVLSNLPVGLVPSVGPNVFLAYSLVAKHVCSTDEALAISSFAGLLLLVFSLTPVVKLALGLVPLSVKFGLVLGTGLLTALIGLKAIGVVVPDVGGSDIVALGPLDTLEVKIAVVFLIITATLLHLAVKGAVLLGMLGATAAYWIATGDYPSRFFAPRELSPHAMDLRVLFRGSAWLQVGALLLMLIFSISGATIGSARMAGLLRPDGGVNGRTSVFVCCGLATVVSGALGSGPIFTSMSSAAGIRDGGRTGLVSVVIGLYSLLMAFLLSPLATAIPKCAISPVLVLVGLSMTGEAAEVHWGDVQEALPAFLCAVFQPFTYSVANGIFAGVGMSVVLFFTTGRFITYMPGLRAIILCDGGVAPKDRTPAKDRPLAWSRQSSPGVRPSPEPRPSPGGRPSPALRPARHEPPLLEGGDLMTPVALETGSSPILHNVGVATTEKASLLVRTAAAKIGFDGDAVQRIFEERITASRNVQAHYVSGTPGFEQDFNRAWLEAADMAQP